ncbi:MAG: Gfo/Idh/MocA family protein [Haloarculaceae archaeon]
MRFGVLSTADIAREDVIPGIRKSPHEVTAIASRDADRARQVANDLGIPRSYGSYEDLLADDEIDAVYNPLPNGLHAEWTERAADHGKHVLCEKPLTADAEAAADLFDYCAERDVVLMEAFMYQFHPRTHRLREIVEEELGEIRSVSTAFKFRLDDEGDIRLDPELAGGSLMDVGCYAVSGARGILGEPNRVYAHTADTRNSGVDTDLAGTLEYNDGVVARVACGFDTPEVQFVRVEAVDGWAEARRAFAPEATEEVAVTYEVDGRHTTERFDAVDHYQLEVEGFAEAVESGKEPLVDRAETVNNMRVIDALYESAERGESVAVE